MYDMRHPSYKSQLTGYRVRPMHGVSRLDGEGGEPLVVGLVFIRVIWQLVYVSVLLV